MTNLAEGEIEPRTSWNKGLTKQIDERLRNIGEKISLAKKGCKAWNSGRHYYDIRTNIVQQELNATGYFLGWLITDGHLSKKNGVQFGVKESDGYELKRHIERMLRISPPLHTYLDKDGTLQFIIWSKGLVVTINELHEVPIGRKKDIVNVPKKIMVSNNRFFVGGFIRGVYEGDGSAGVYASNRQVTLCGNPNFLTNLKGLLRAWNVFTCRIRKMGGCDGFNIKAKSFGAFFDLIYQHHENFYLERKLKMLKEVVAAEPQKYVHSTESKIKISESLRCYYNSKPNRVHHILTKDFLINAYINEGKSAIKIGKEVGCSSTTLYRYMQNIGIRRRSQRDAKIVGRRVYGF